MKKSSIALIAVFVVLGVVIILAASSSNSGLGKIIFGNDDTVVKTCTDSDVNNKFLDGLNYGTTGTIKFLRSSFRDYCKIDGKTLIEYYCKNGLITKTTYECPNGCDKSQGRCK